jgi:hypothetical protein
MHKKIITVILSAILLVTLAAPALAVDTADGMSVDTQLAQVTLIVKNTLNIGDSYKGFTGNLTDKGSTGFWELNWTGDSDTITVYADKNGKVMSYYHWKDKDNDVNNNIYAPIFPKTEQKDALNAAKSFIERLLGDNETLSINNDTQSYYTASAVYYSFNGTVELNGLKSPVTFYTQVRTDDMSISSFNRSDLYSQYTEIPSATPTVSKDIAAGMLAGKIKLQLEYVLSADGKSATLQYVPVYTGNYIVKADTGELVDLDAASNSDTTASTRDMAMGGAGEGKSKLSDVEQSTVDALKGVKSRAELDAAIRAVSELGLTSDYQIISSSYTMNKDTGEVLCRLQYEKTISDASAVSERFPSDYSNMNSSGSGYSIQIYKNVTVNAMTASLISIDTYNSGSEESVKLSSEQLKSNAETFLSRYFNDKYSLTAYNEDQSSPDNGNFAFSQEANSVPFPTNTISISVSSYDGTINNLYINWTDNVSFESKDGIIDAAAAKLAYIGVFKTELQYVNITTKQSGVEPYLDSKIGIASGNCKLALAYKFDTDSNVSGIDAKTGKPIAPSYNQTTEALTYNDIDSCYGKTQIEKLAKYNIGFSGGSFKPTAQLTQKDAISLLLSSAGYLATTDDELYNGAYQYNLLTKGEKNADKILTRAEYVKMLVGATEYGSAAKLKGIYSCGFSDDSSISSDSYGYVAIAKALGIVHGDADNNLNPNSSISRQDAAIMLYNFMSR